MTKIQLMYLYTNFCAYFSSSIFPKSFHGYMNTPWKRILSLISIGDLDLGIYSQNQYFEQFFPFTLVTAS